MTVLAQISDPHINVGRRDREPAQGLTAAVRGVLDLSRPPDAVLVSGDLVDDPGARQYERVRELLTPLPMPVFVLAGNHDDRDALREYFALADGATGAAAGPFRYSARVGELRLIGCDTTVDGTDAGAFGLEHRVWLEAELASEPTRPTIVAMHHPPMLTGLTALDEICLPQIDRLALGELLPAHPQVARIISGHVHRGAFATLGGCGVMTCPSTFRQAPLELGMTEVELIAEPAAFAVHALVEGELVSHLQPILEP
jgi:3',5'-cyclic AMP phosphodiesterase CpdA